MFAVFTASFRAAFVPVAEIFLIVFAAGLLMRRKVLAQGHVTALSQTTVYVFLPAMIFANIVGGFKPGVLPYWWVLPLGAALQIGAGLLLGTLAFWRGLPEKRDRLTLCSMPNATYLALPLGMALFPAEFERYALYVFLYLLVYNPLLWSVGNALSTGGGRPFTWKGLLTPPFVAGASALGLVFSGLAPHVPTVLVKACKLLGDATTPTATFILGAVLGSIPLGFRRLWTDAARVITVKLLLLPALTAVVLLWWGVRATDPLLGSFFIIEAAAAPAVGIILQIRTYGGDEETAGGIMMLCYLGMLATLPAAVALWNSWGVGR